MSINNTLTNSSLLKILGLIISGFVAGIGTYQFLLEITNGSSLISIERNLNELDSLEKELKSLKLELSATDSISIKPKMVLEDGSSQINDNEEIARLNSRLKDMIERWNNAAEVAVSCHNENEKLSAEKMMLRYNLEKNNITVKAEDFFYKEIDDNGSRYFEELKITLYVTPESNKTKNVLVVEQPENRRLIEFSISNHEIRKLPNNLGSLILEGSKDYSTNKNTNHVLIVR